MGYSGKEMGKRLIYIPRKWHGTGAFALGNWGMNDYMELRINQICPWIWEIVILFSGNWDIGPTVLLLFPWNWDLDLL